MNTNPAVRFQEHDAWVLVAIASQHEHGGAETEVVREGVDFYQRVGLLTDEELHGGLARLEKAGFIEQRENRFFVSGFVLRSAPRTSSGRLPLRDPYWYVLLGLKP